MNDMSYSRARGKPFRPGESGNRKGRPKGALNEADILKRYLIQPLGRGKAKTSAVEAILRQQFSKAMSGDQSAQKLIFDFREKLGLGEEVTSDERERRTLTLPRPNGWIK